MTAHYYHEFLFITLLCLWALAQIILTLWTVYSLQIEVHGSQDGHLRSTINSTLLHKSSCPSPSLQLLFPEQSPHLSVPAGNEVLLTGCSFAGGLSSVSSAACPFPFSLGPTFTPDRSQPQRAQRTTPHGAWENRELGCVLLGAERQSLGDMAWGEQRPFLSFGATREQVLCGSRDVFLTIIET